MSEPGRSEHPSSRNFFVKGFQRLFGGAQEEPLPDIPLRPKEEILRDIEEQKYSNNREFHNNQLSLDAAEIAYQPLMQELSQVLIRELHGIRGKRGLIIIVDDEERKIKEADGRLKGHEKGSKVHYAIQGMTDGVAGVVLYQEFSKVAPNENVVMVIDGLLGGGMLPSGVEVLRRLIQNTSQTELPMPYTVGGSSISGLNGDLYKEAPDLYLGSILSYAETYKNIDSVL